MSEGRLAMPMAADQNLHFGVLALQASLLDALQFVDSAAPVSTPTGGATPPYIASFRVSKYERKNVHATGGMGKIWQAHDTKLDREIDIKEIAPTWPARRRPERPDAASV